MTKNSWTILITRRMRAIFITWRARLLPSRKTGMFVVSHEAIAKWR
ncbi:MAG: hypothetical protein N2381_08180 [Armatimonadetes bacterium]|nr:hypothetical protein [Armatimonadota bacterium]MCX7778012.1 hypothetical protein [Armatimonadota bacterium]